MPQAEMERLLALAEFLPIEDALLVRELLGSGRTIAHLSRLMGVSRHRVRSRVNRLLARTSDPAFRYVVSRRLKACEPGEEGRSWRAPARLVWPEEWPETMRIAAQMCILDGLSCRDASRRSNVSFHVLRRQVSVLRELGRLWRPMRLREAS